jgi:hypothetical protein
VENYGPGVVKSGARRLGVNVGQRIKSFARRAKMIAAHIEPILIVTGAVTAIALINLLAPLWSL